MGIYLMKRMYLFSLLFTFCIPGFTQDTTTTTKFSIVDSQSKPLATIDEKGEVHIFGSCEEIIKTAYDYTMKISMVNNKDFQDQQKLQELYRKEIEGLQKVIKSQKDLMAIYKNLVCKITIHLDQKDSFYCKP